VSNAPLPHPKFARLGIVVGLTAEARLARPFGRVAAGGGTAEGAAAAAKRLVAEGAQALLSFGLAGALDPALRPGALIIPRAVLSEGALFPTGIDIGAETVDLVLAEQRVLASADDKRNAWHETGAAAVDLESGAVARVAKEAKIGFGVLRAVCDPAERNLPPAALIALDQQGRIGLIRILASVAKQPRQIPQLLTLARDAGAARQTLKQARPRGFAPWTPTRDSVPGPPIR